MSLFALCDQAVCFGFEFWIIPASLLWTLESKVWMIPAFVVLSCMLHNGVEESVHNYLVMIDKTTAAPLMSLSFCFGCDRLSQQKKKIPVRILTAARDSRRQPQGRASRSSRSSLIWQQSLRMTQAMTTPLNPPCSAPPPHLPVTALQRASALRRRTHTLRRRMQTLSTPQHLVTLKFKLSAPSQARSLIPAI